MKKKIFAAKMATLYFDLLPSVVNNEIAICNDDFARICRLMSEKRQYFYPYWFNYLLQQEGDPTLVAVLADDANFLRFSLQDENLYLYLDNAIANILRLTTRSWSNLSPMTEENIRTEVENRRSTYPERKKNIIRQLFFEAINEKKSNVQKILEKQVDQTDLLKYAFSNVLEGKKIAALDWAWNNSDDHNIRDIDHLFRYIIGLGEILLTNWLLDHNFIPTEKVWQHFSRSEVPYASEESYKRALDNLAEKVKYTGVINYDR